MSRSPELDVCIAMTATVSKRWCVGGSNFSTNGSPDQVPSGGETGHRDSLSRIFPRDRRCDASLQRLSAVDLRRAQEATKNLPNEPRMA